MNPEVLLYHRVADCAPDNQYLSVAPANFEAHLDVLSSRRQVIPLYDLVHLACKGHLVEAGAAITFDDGYADNLINALPLLEKYRCHATVFVTAKLLGHPHGFWYDVLEDVLLNSDDLPEELRIDLLDTTFSLRTNDERLACHEALFNVLRSASVRMTTLLLHEFLEATGRESTRYTSPTPLLAVEQLRELAASPWIEIGSHTLTHPLLSQLSEPEQKKEITQSKAMLEELTGRPVRLFGYPFGDLGAFNECTCKLTAEAGMYGIANIQNHISLPLDPMRVPRRLVRNWSGQVFARWLDSVDKDKLESQTTGPRLQMLYKYLQQRHNPVGVNQIRRLETASRTSHPLNVVHLNTPVGNGGASKIAELLASLQEAMGHSPRILTAESAIDDPLVALYDAAPSPSLAQQVQAEGLLDYHMQGSHTLHRHDVVKNAQLVHLHNLHHKSFNPWSLPGIARLRPTVWTLHDMQSLTGHCAHSFRCTRWQQGCGLCPDLKTYPQIGVDSSHRIWRDKKMLYNCSPVHIVTPSQWLAGHVAKSSLGEHPLSVIPNGIDTQLFTPRDKKAVRAKLGIAEHTLVMGCAAHGGPIENYWKGGHFSMKVLRELRKRHPDVLFLGRGNVEEVTAEGMRLLPYTQNEDEMADFYAALDFVLYPTLADNCPLTVLEAMACGTPVVAFSVGGLPELVDNGETGLIVPENDAEALTQAVFALVGQAEVRTRMGFAAREKAEREYDARVMANRYDRVYEEVLKSWPRRKAAASRIAPRDVPELVNTPGFREMARASDLLISSTAGCAMWKTEPTSRAFGLDRGQAIDRYFIERFLADHAANIRGRVLEVADNAYTKQFGTSVTQSDVLHAVPDPQATFVGDLASAGTLPHGVFDCIILTQTLHVIYDIKSVLHNLGASLAPGGKLLLTAPCISPVSRYDMDRWGDFWRFTDRCLKQLIEECIPDSDVKVCGYGNYALVTAFLDGLCTEEVPPVLFEKQDSDYYMLLAACVTKNIRKVHIDVESSLDSELVKANDGKRVHCYYPTQLAIEPVHGCNAKCIMCPQKMAKRKKGVLKTAHLSMMLEKIRQWGAPIHTISHAGLGEPLLDNELEQKITRDKSIFPEANVVVYSNGALLDEERARSLLDTGVNTLSFSINALDAGTYKAITGLERSITYTNVLRLIELRNASQSKTRIHVSCIPIPELPQPELVAFQRFWGEKADLVCVPPRINWGGDLGDVMPDAQHRLPCNYIFSVMMVDWDGTVKRCCEDYDSKYPMGNILLQDPNEIFNSRMMVEQRKQQLLKDFSNPYICRRCIETSKDVAASFWSNGGGVRCL